MLYHYSFHRQLEAMKHEHFVFSKVSVLDMDMSGHMSDTLIFFFFSNFGHSYVWILL